jgi:DNA-binding response OmpR family regulator
MRRRILVVEDNLDQARMLATLIRLMGHEVRCEDNGAAAIAAARRLRPDLVLLDLGLPGGDGFEVARRLREEFGAGLRIIALTAYGSERDREHATGAGCDLHLVKPADPRFLESLLSA